MPRKQVDLDYSLDYLSILDENDELDEELEPDIEADELRQMFRVMLSSRRFDERLLTLQRQGRVGTFAPVQGQEACQIGAMSALGDDDWFVPAFREFAAMQWRGFALTQILLHTAGYNEGGAIPEDRHDFPLSVPVASQLPHAVGLGFASDHHQRKEVTIVFFGDGATSEGDFHEGMNLAGVLQTPTIFLCQNNRWAISLPSDQQTHSQTFAQKALAYGIPALQVDGNDVLAVRAAVAEAAERARAGNGPTFIECLTYRLNLHTTADDPTKYRSQEEVEAWEKRDPLPRFQRYLTQQGIITDDDVETLEDEIKQEIDQAWKDTAEQIKKLDDPAVMFDYLYAERPPYLESQRQAFMQRQNDGS